MLTFYPGGARIYIPGVEVAQAGGGVEEEAFSPSSLDLSIWLKADAGTFQTSGGSAAVATNDPVGEWQDAGGSANHVANTLTARPTLQLDIVNDLPVVRADAINDLLYTASTSAFDFGTADFSIFFVVHRTTAGDNTKGFVGNLQNSGQFNGFYVGMDTSGRIVANCRVGGSNQFITDPANRANQLVIGCVVRASGTVKIYINNQETASGSGSGDVSGAELGVFAIRSAEPSQIWGGDIGEIGIANYAFSAQQRSDIFDYLTARWVLSGYYAYFNGRNEGISTYAIGLAVSANGKLFPIDSLEVLQLGTGWEGNHIKDPYVLRDGSTYKMWYSGSDDGVTYRIGYATSLDGLGWTKSGSNPVLNLGAGGSWDANGVAFPLVYKDNDAITGKRYRMLYRGTNAAGKTQIGYAYSADGISWTKGGANPVVALGTAGQFDDDTLCTGALVKDGATYYLFYGGGIAADGGGYIAGKVGLVTFTDFEGMYTKSSNNPLISMRIGNQALTANTSNGSATVKVADSSIFAVSEGVFLYDPTAGEGHESKILAIPDGTTITLATVAWRNFTTGNGSRIISRFASLGAPRAAVKETGVWHMWLVGWRIGTSSYEVNGYASSANPDSGWVLDITNDPPQYLPAYGQKIGWDATTRENHAFVLDADTNQRVTI